MLGGSQSPRAFSPGDSKKEPPPCSARSVQSHMAGGSATVWHVTVRGLGVPTLLGCCLGLCSGLPRVMEELGPTTEALQPAHTCPSYCSVCLLRVWISCGGASELCLHSGLEWLCCTPAAVSSGLLDVGWWGGERVCPQVRVAVCLVDLRARAQMFFLDSAVCGGEQLYIPRPVCLGG